MRTPWFEESRDLEERDFELMHVPERYRELDWDRVVAGEMTLEALSKYRAKLKKAWDKGLGLYIWGPNGSGKTAVGCLLLSEFRSHGQPALFIRANRMFASAFKDERLSDDKPSLWRHVHEVPVLLIDDFGKNYRDMKGYSDLQFEGLLRDRYDNRLVTLITSNITPDRIRDEDGDWGLKESTLSILGSVAVPLKVDGKDHRKDEREGLDGL